MHENSHPSPRTPQPTVFYGSIQQSLCIPTPKNLFPRKSLFPGNFLESRGPSQNFSETASLDFSGDSTSFRGQDYQNLTSRTDFTGKVVRNQISLYLETLICSHMVNFQPFLMNFFFKYNVLM